MLEPIAKDCTAEYMRTEEGQRRMSELRRALRGMWILDVSFHATIHGVMARLTFHQHTSHMDLLLPELRLDTVLEHLGSVRKARPKETPKP